jgi:hypothetical protein
MTTGVVFTFTAVNAVGIRKRKPAFRNFCDHLTGPGEGVFHVQKIPLSFGIIRSRYVDREFALKQLEKVFLTTAANSPFRVIS